jgi:hypothetical protein
MDKKYLHHLWTHIRPVKTWYLLALFLVSATVCVFALRSNNLTMAKLRDNVYQADKNSGNVEDTLQKLRSYVNAHMNTSLATGSDAVYPPIQLKYTYQRLQQAELEKVNGVNSQVYTDAQHYCEQLYPSSFSGGPRVPCIESYVSQHGTKAKAIPDSLYKFDFASPEWSPDLAGWSLFLSIVFLVLTIVRFGLGAWLKSVTK